MPRWSVLLTVAALTAFPPESAIAGGVFPYEVRKRTLENGLDVLVIETPEFKGVVNLVTMILAGSRNEVEKGRTGLAHLFEHMAFRHKFEDPAGSYVARMEKMGAFDNGWTWFDVTYYHPVTFAANFATLAHIQAERFVSMDFTERIYRTEAGAVLGEYRRIASDPSQRMEEVQADLVYGRDHGYGHTTMGYLSDVMDMPNSYASGRAFYETYYRPNNAVVIVAGDVQAPEVFDTIAREYGPWKPGKLPQLPRVKPLNGPLRGHVEWESDVPPRVTYAHLVPPFEPGAPSSAVLLIVPELLAGKTAPLLQKLRYEKKTATDLFINGDSARGFDSRLLEIFVRLDKTRFDKEGRALFAEIEKDLAAGCEELHHFSRRADAAKVLAALQSKVRCDFLAGLDSPQSIAAAVGLYYRFRRDPRILDIVMESIAKLTPVDIDAFATRHLVPANAAVVTMCYRGAPAAGASAIGAASAGAAAANSE